MSERRTQIDRWLDQGAQHEARAGLSELLFAEGLSHAAAAFSLARYEKLRSSMSLVPFRVAILRSFTVEPIVPLLKASGFANGLDLTVELGAFNAYAAELLDQSSALYRFGPDAVILAVETRSLAPELWSEFADLAASDVDAVVDRVIRQYGEWVQALRRGSDAHLILHALEAPAWPALGVYDGQRESGQRAAIAKINRRLSALAGDNAGVHVLDYPGLVGRHGQQNWHDEGKWLSVRLPIRAAQQAHLAHEWLRFLQPLSGRLAKVVVVDLDNTLWGGVAGEDGPAAIRLSGEHPGAGYQALQRALLDLTRRGILLAVASKNNPEDALEVLEKHPGMRLRPRDFAAMRINWNEKTQSLREIAGELNVGLDGLAFLDDNPVERHRIRIELPEVMVVDLPEDPIRFAETIWNCPFFERLALSEEDRKRSEYYAAERQRASFETNCTTREDFLNSLEQSVEIAPASPLTIERIAQLTQKTNQFNLTTRRYSDQQIAALMREPGCRVLSIRVKDRYCDNGLVGVAITRDAGSTCEVDTFLLSCRVIGRGVESAFLAALAELARQRGQRRLQGWFLPTRKNEPAREFYSSQGFQLIREATDGTLWAIDLGASVLPWPMWIAKWTSPEVIA